MKKNYVLLFFFSLLVGSSAIAQTVRYVKAGGTGNGSSWSNASGDLQTMINASSSRDQVWVQKGIYKPKSRPDNPQVTTPNDRFNSFLLKAEVSVFGGFAGTEGNGFDLRTRDFIANETILSGNIGDLGVVEDNTFHVVTVAGEMGKRTEFDGFTIEDGCTEAVSGSSNAILVNNQTIPSTRSPGIVVYYVDFIEFTNLVVRNNTNAASGQNAGAIYMFNGSGNLRNVTFLNNKTAGGSGGAMYTYGSSNIPSNINYYNVDFIGNVASTYGGGVYMGQYSNLKFYDCSFVANTAAGNSGGGFYLGSSTSSADFYNTDFIDNVSETNGGAINAPNSGRMNINGGTFRNNNSTTNNSGGAIYASASGLVLNIKGAEFRENKTLVASGGAMYLQSGTFVVEDCKFIDNESASSAGALYINTTTAASHKIINCEFRGNKAVSNGGAAYIVGPDVDFRTCRFINNTAGASGGAISFSAPLKTLTVINSLFYGNATNTTGTAGGGGAIYFYASTNGNLINNSFVANKTTVSSRPGGLLYMAGTNTVNFLNSLSYLNVGASASTPDRNEFYAAAAGTVFNIKNSLLQYYGTTGVNGNIVGQNPLFQSTTYGSANFMEVTAGSPIIDKGVASNIPVALELDALGKGRINNGIIDIGAVEYLGAAVVAPTKIAIDENLAVGQKLGDNNIVNNVPIPISNKPNISLLGAITSWTITAGNEAGAFAIGSAGELSVANSLPLNYEVTKQFLLTVSLSNGLDNQKVTIIVDINNVSEIPEKPIIDNIVNGNVVTTYRPTIRGLAEPNSVVTIYIDGVKYPFTAKADEDGVYAFRFPEELKPGLKVFTVTAKIDGVESGKSATTIVNLKLYGGGTLGLKPTNIITLKTDGKNDVWKIENLSVMYPKHEIVVYDKVGKIVFKWLSSVNGPYDSNNDNGMAWNGTYNGSPLNSGTYYYDINVGAGLDRIKGTITILKGR